ncbi:MAG TPA: DUF2268 domain-containing putative Zn-dependent protease [Gemmatimonadales bacterium]|nr:DUF2268 domain-containing putative Zn-dependent protease [Gemmatimonadales bacterium]
MLINLVPEFLDVLRSPDSEAAYRRYHDNHRLILDAYWRNYVLEPDTPPATEVVHHALRADRADLYRLLEQHDLEEIVERAVERAHDVLGLDRPADVYLMVGMGAANAGELVVNGRGAAFVCVEHFTGKVNPETFGLGLSPKLIPLWVAHELAHAARYTSPRSRSEIARLVQQEYGGYFDAWQVGSRATLREQLVNEGLAVHAAQAVAPGHDPADYFGYPRRQYTRLRELEAFLRRAAGHEMDESGLGLRLRYLSGGMSPSARLLAGRVIPERSGYYLGWRMTEAIVAEVGIAEALRASAQECRLAEERGVGIRTA